MVEFTGHSVAHASLGSVSCFAPLNAEGACYKMCLVVVQQRVSLVSELWRALLYIVRWFVCVFVYRQLRRLYRSGWGSIGILHLIWLLIVWEWSVAYCMQCQTFNAVFSYSESEHLQQNHVCTYTYTCVATIRYLIVMHTHADYYYDQSCIEQWLLNWSWSCWF